MLLELNNNYNSVMTELVDSVTKVSSQLEQARENMTDGPQYMASIDLDKLREADTSLDTALEKLMESYFEKSHEDSGDYQTEVTRYGLE